VEYRLKIGKDTIPVEVDTQEERNLKMVIGGKGFDVRYSVISDNQIHMVVNGDGGISQVNAYVSDGPDGKIVMINGIPYLVSDIDAQGQRTRKGEGRSIPEQVTPPMPAVVVRLLVGEGDHVEKGQSVIVVSAMKMETTLCAPFAGKVKKVNVAVDDKVAPGQILVDIEKDEAVK
jgi:3-methylcrotonyl-CoA carboxylase alpha subunit